MFPKIIKTGILTLLAYLLQVTVSGVIQIGGVGPNIAIAMISAVAIALGRKYAFAMSTMVGYLLEIMLAPMTYINVVLYPLCCTLSAFAFSDKSERKLEEERTKSKYKKQLSPLLRTMLCAMTSIVLFEIVHLTYTYLNGVALSQNHLIRALTDVLYTTVLAFLLQFPIRSFLGIRSLRRSKSRIAMRGDSYAKKNRG